MTSDQLLEQNLSFSLVINLATGILFITLSFFGILTVPQVFRPFSSQIKNFKQILFWPLDVSRQPLSSFSKKGNLATIYIYFSKLYFGLIVRLFLYSLMLQILYFFGNNQTHSNLTFYSKLIISNLSEESFAFFSVPVAAFFICQEVIRFFENFMIVYINFRQKCMQRAIPSNYAVLARNIPDELFFSLFDNFEDIVSVIPCLEKKQQRQYMVLKHYIVRLEKLKIKQQKQYCKYSCIQNVKNSKFWIINNLMYFQSYFLKAYYKYYVQKIANKYLIISIKKHQVYNELSPYLPSIKNDCKDFSIGETMYLRKYFEYGINTPKYYQPVLKKQGKNAFLVCNSQVAAAQKIGLLLTSDRKKPEIIPAPYYADIQWDKLSRSDKIVKLSTLMTFISIIISFLFFFGVQSFTIQMVNNNGMIWIQFVQDNLCSSQLWCESLVNSIISYAYGLIPTIFASLLPIIIEIAVKPANTVSNTHQIALKYKILYIFLILLNGILQIAFPAALDPETGKFDLSFLATANISEIIFNIGENIPLQIFSFLTFLVTKYLNQAPGQIFGVGDIIKLAIGCVLPNVAKTKHYQNVEFDYYISLAGKLHMFTIAMMYIIIAPIAFDVLLLIEFFNQFCERYLILYKSKPVPSNEMSPGVDIIKMVLDDIYYSTIYLLICTISYGLTTGNVILKWSSIFLAVVGIYLFFRKLGFNSSYKESSQQLATGNNKLQGKEILQLPISYIHSNQSQQLQVKVVGEDIFGKSLAIKGSYDANQIALCYCHPACFLDIE